MDPVDGFVLAGGASSRMGTDKAKVVWQGRPLAEGVVETLRRVCQRVVLVRHEAEEWPGIEVIADPPGARHPLRGVVAALNAARGRYALIAPVDVPAVSEKTLRALLAARAPGGSRAEGQPLLAVLPVSLLPTLTEAVASGKSVFATLASCTVVPVAAHELRNLNTPRDLDG